MPGKSLHRDAFQAALEQAVAAEGLELLGVVRLGEEPAFPRFVSWLGEGKQAGMDYLAQHTDLRRDPRDLLAGARSAIVIALPYYLGDKHVANFSPERPRIAQYARLADYHKILWRKGERILVQFHEAMSEFDRGVGRVVVDSAPILERALAARTTRGFIGKNTCYIHPEKGSFLLLAELLTTLDLSADEPATVAPDERTSDGGCGTCRRCQVNCPTGALDQAYSLDANRCLAYWTIEHRGPIPERFWPWLRYYYFGCDICQLVCPYNRHAEPVAPSSALRRLDEFGLYEIATLSQSAYEQAFGGTPLTRAKRHGLRRNALIAMTVTAHPRLADALAQITADDHEVLHATKAQIAGWLAAKRT